jgi:hypothetical protein
VDQSGWFCSDGQIARALSGTRVFVTRAECAECGKFDTPGKSIPIFRNRVKPQNQKYFAFPEMQIMALIPSSRPTRGAFRDRHDALGWGCDGRFGVRRFLRRTKTSRRTAKSCGPGAATLALSFAGSFP